MATARQITVLLKKATAKTVKTIALEITANIIEATPVDTGFARANWIPSVGAPSRAVDGSSSAQSTGMAFVSGYKVGQGSVFISNNVRYIQKLADGSSNQAPSGWVRAAVQQGVASVS